MAPSSSADGRGHKPEGRKSPRGGRGRSPSLQRGEHVTEFLVRHWIPVAVHPVPPSAGPMAGSNGREMRSRASREREKHLRKRTLARGAVHRHFLLGRLAAAVSASASGSQVSTIIKISSRIACSVVAPTSCATYMIGAASTPIWPLLAPTPPAP